MYTRATQMIAAFTSLLMLFGFLQLPAGAIGGRITLDATGQPLSGVGIQLLKKDYDQQGLLRTSVIATAFTNDGGQYRFTNVYAGRYHLLTVARAARTNDIYLPVYYSLPGGNMDLLPGQTRTDIDIAVRRGRLVNLRGEVIDGLRRRLPHLDWFTLTPHLSGVPDLSGVKRIRYTNRNTFEFLNLVPGSYYIGLYRLDDEYRAEAVTSVDIAEDDIDDFLIVTGRGCDLRGRVHLEGSAQIAAAARLRLILRPLNNPLSVATRSAGVSPDGRVSFTALPCNAAFQLFVDGVPPGYYMKSATVRKVDVLEKGLSPDGGPYPLEVVLAHEGGAISGAVLDAQRKPVDRSYIVLVPKENGLSRPDLYKVANTDQHGQFRIVDVAPGDYDVYALEELDGREYYAPDFRKRFAGLGQHIKVISNRTVSIQLPRVP